MTLSNPIIISDEHSADDSVPILPGNFKKLAMSSLPLRLPGSWYNSESLKPLQFLKEFSNTSSDREFLVIMGGLLSRVSLTDQKKLIKLVLMPKRSSKSPSQPEKSRNLYRLFLAGAYGVKESKDPGAFCWGFSSLLQKTLKASSTSSTIESRTAAAGLITSALGRWCLLVSTKSLLRLSRVIPSLYGMTKRIKWSELPGDTRSAVMGTLRAYETLGFLRINRMTPENSSGAYSDGPQPKIPDKNEVKVALGLLGGYIDAEYNDPGLCHISSEVPSSLKNLVAEGIQADPEWMVDHGFLPQAEPPIPAGRGFIGKAFCMSTHLEQLKAPLHSSLLRTFLIAHEEALVGPKTIPGATNVSIREAYEKVLSTMTEEDRIRWCTSVRRSHVGRDDPDQILATAFLIEVDLHVARAIGVPGSNITKVLRATVQGSEVEEFYIDERVYEAGSNPIRSKPMLHSTDWPENNIWRGLQHSIVQDVAFGAPDAGLCSRLDTEFTERIKAAGPTKPSNLFSLITYQMYEAVAHNYYERIGVNAIRSRLQYRFFEQAHEVEVATVHLLCAENPEVDKALSMLGSTVLKANTGKEAVNRPHKPGGVTWPEHLLAQMIALRMLSHVNRAIKDGRTYESAVIGSIVKSKDSLASLSALGREALFKNVLSIITRKDLIAEILPSVAILDQKKLEIAIEKRLVSQERPRPRSTSSPLPCRAR